MPAMPSRTRSSSARLVRAAAAERMALMRERERLARRREARAQQLASVEAQLAEVEERVELIDRLAPEAANVHPLPSRGDETGLRGAAIRQAAIDALLAQPGGPAPIHYKTWFDLLEASGRRVAGKDPLAVFLTQISRSPVVRRTTRSGVYELDLEAPERLRARLRRLHERLVDGADAVADVGTAGAAAREQRERILAEIAATERALAEAARALPGAGSPRAEAG
jgi:hypothetical protein